MDQYPFNFEIIIVGCDVDGFIEMLYENGYIEQAKNCQDQFKQQLFDIHDFLMNLNPQT